MKHYLATPTLASACALMIASGAIAQTESLIFAFTGPHTTLDGGGGLVDAGRIRPDEVGVVTPTPGSAYSARGLIGTATQWAWRGDDNGDGNLVDSATEAPGKDIDALMIKRFLGAPVSPTVRDICISKEDDYSTLFGALDGDVIYHPTQGTVAKFITEAQIATATGATTIDIDAICQNVNGDLYISFDTGETMTGGTGDDSGIIRIPALALTYDPVTGDVTAAIGGLAEILSDEAFLLSTINNSGILNRAGDTPHLPGSIDLQGLEIDPLGGTWTSPLTGSWYPNLLMSWQSVSAGDGGIVSTAGGGTIATVNGVPMGSTTATSGVHVGLAPTINGLSDLVAIAVIGDLELPILVENYPENRLTTTDSGFSRQEVTGATPAGLVAFLVSINAYPSATAFVSFPAPAPFFGEIFEPGAPVFAVATTTTADGLGYASQILDVSSLIGTGFTINWQAFDAGSLTFSLPAPIQFP